VRSQFLSTAEIITIPVFVYDYMKRYRSLHLPCEIFLLAIDKRFYWNPNMVTDTADGQQSEISASASRFELCNAFRSSTEYADPPIVTWVYNGFGSFTCTRILH
jgi:hypothetical protein